MPTELARTQRSALRELMDANNSLRNLQAELQEVKTVIRNVETAVDEAETKMANVPVDPCGKKTKVDVHHCLDYQHIIYCGNNAVDAALKRLVSINLEIKEHQQHINCLRRTLVETCPKLNKVLGITIGAP